MPPLLLFDRDVPFTDSPPPPRRAGGGTVVTLRRSPICRCTPACLRAGALGFNAHTGGGRFGRRPFPRWENLFSAVTLLTWLAYGKGDDMLFAGRMINCYIVSFVLGDGAVAWRSSVKGTYVQATAMRQFLKLWLLRVLVSDLVGFPALFSQPAASCAALRILRCHLIIRLLLLFWDSRVVWIYGQTDRLMDVAVRFLLTLDAMAHYVFAGCRSRSDLPEQFAATAPQRVTFFCDATMPPPLLPLALLGRWMGRERRLYARGSSAA